jgi:hypothetical protein
LLEGNNIVECDPRRNRVKQLFRCCPDKKFVLDISGTRRYGPRGRVFFPAYGDTRGRRI